jgi:glutamate carboxypeptidase
MNDALPPAIDRSARSLLEQFTGTSSASGDAAGLDRFAGLLAHEFASRGMGVQIERHDGKPVFLARGPAAADRPLLLLSHLDTVLPARPPQWDGDRLLATGSIDTKAGLACLLSAFDLLRSEGLDVPADLCLAAVPDEEVAGEVSHRVTRHLGTLARAIWVLEPGEPRDGAETLVAGRRGMFGWSLKVHGRSAHSGLHFWRGASALDAASRFATASRALSARGRGATVNPARLVAGDSSFVEDLARQHAMAGTGRQTNVVPDCAWLDGEARFLTTEEGAVVRQQLEELRARIAEETATSLSIEYGERVPPVDPRGPQRAACEKAVALAAARGWALEIEDDRGGISFSNFLEDPGRVPILDGLAPVGGGMHTRDEFLDWKSFERRTYLLRDLLAAEPRLTA